MPKATDSGHTSQNYYRISPFSVSADISSPRQYPSIAATMQSSMQSQHMSQSDLASYATGGPVQPLQYHHQQMPLSPPLPVRASSGAWTPSDDAQLMSARAQGLNWQPIQAAYFPNKTPNACRKRHERLMDRRNSDDWDTFKLETLAKEYMGMRREMWSQLGAKTGEKWSVVEAKCMQSGIKNLQSAARACARRERLETGSMGNGGLSGPGSSLLPVQHHHHHSHSHSHDGGHNGYGDPHSADDSGIGIDELEAEYQSVAGDAGSYGAHSGASLSSDDQDPSRGGPVKLYPTPVGSGGPRGSGGYDTRGDMYVSAQQQQMSGGGSGRDRGPERNGYMQQQQQQQRPQYGMQQRLPSIDMGIGAIINRAPGAGGL